MGAHQITMKTILALSVLVAVATADTCTDCTALVSTLGAHLVSEHSLAEQDEIMVGGLCPQAENVDECETGIMKSQEQLLNPKTIDYLVEQLTPIICASNEDERCPRVVDTVIRQGLPLLAAEVDTSEIPEICNAAV